MFVLLAGRGAWQKSGDAGSAHWTGAGFYKCSRLWSPWTASRRPHRLRGG